MILVVAIGVKLFSLPTSNRRSPTQISEFFDLQAIFIPKNPPSTPKTSSLLTF
jgi:hypothetical protein